MFSKGTIRSSGRLQEMHNDLSDLISGMEARVYLYASDKKHLGIASASIDNLKEASKFKYRALERLNFPGKVNNPGM